ncbi:MAG: hypothetical protein H6707_05685 [Deltaproteobacteria bacterium]|nr:hypothetical protein [Deltaproteobacteria bacterium]
MRWIGFLLALLLFTGSTAGALVASTLGWGLPGLLSKPVSIRQSSVRSGSGRGPVFLYFGSRRRHFGGGFHGGK